MEREDPRDAWVSSRYARIRFARVRGGGHIQPAPVALLRALRPDLKIEPLRGNLDTRLRKLDDGLYDGIVLAAAGLKAPGAGRTHSCRAGAEQMLRPPGRVRWVSRCAARAPTWRHCSRWRTSRPGWPWPPSAL